VCSAPLTIIECHFFFADVIIFRMKKVISMIDFQNVEQALLSLWFVSAVIFFGYPF